MMENSFELYDQASYFESSEDSEEQIQQHSLDLHFNNLDVEMPQAQGYLKNQHAKETPLQFFQFSQQNAACKICYKYAINGVLCKNSKCSVLFCGSCAVDTIKRIDNKCPFCRISPFQYISSPFKAIINKMELICQLCQEKYILQQEQTHFKRQCQYFKKIGCQFCNQQLMPEQIVKHTRLFHEDKFDEIIQKMYSSPQPLYEPKELLEKNALYLNKINKSPHLGTTGKFYCAGRLQAPKCSCCNGFCGPTNGQNCLQCMKLDIKRLGLPKGHLVNSAGNVCWKVGDEFICGVIIHYQNANCRVGSPCKSCKNMKKNIKRYIDLL